MDPPVKRWRYHAQSGKLEGAEFLSITEDFVRASDYDALDAERLLFQRAASKATAILNEAFNESNRRYNAAVDRLAAKSGASE